MGLGRDGGCEVVEIGDACAKAGDKIQYFMIQRIDRWFQTAVEHTHTHTRARREGQ